MDQERRVKDCKVCQLPHDEELHAAILRLREWHRQQVIKNFPSEQPVHESDRQSDRELVA